VQKTVKRAQKGFTLIELLIVIAVIAILAAIAIPNLLASRQAANESSAISSLRTLVSAQETYRSRQNPPTYGAATDLETAGLIDSALADACATGVFKSGYNFAEATPTANTYAFTATFDTNAGTRTFFVDQSGVIRSSSTGTATLSDPPIQ